MDHVDILSIRRYWDQHIIYHVDRACSLEGIVISTAQIMLIEPVHYKGLGSAQHGSC